MVGSINLDLCVTLERLPEPGETLSASNLERFAGGKVCAAAEPVIDSVKAALATSWAFRLRTANHIIAS